MTLFNHYTATDSDDERCYIVIILFFIIILYIILYTYVFTVRFIIFFFIKSPRGNSSTRIPQTKNDFYLFCVPRTRGTPDRHTRFFFFFFLRLRQRRREKILFLFVFNNNNNNMIDYARRHVYGSNTRVFARLSGFVCNVHFLNSAPYNRGTPVRLSCSIRPSDRRVAVISTVTTFGHNILYYCKCIYRK